MTKEIAVSVCCLTHNHETLIRDAMDGFVMQKTDFPFEIVVHDDASTDSTPTIIREYQKRYSDIINLVFQTENIFYKNYEYPTWFALSACRGKYIAWCDGDDYWTDPLKLQKQYDFMEVNPQCSLCFHEYLTDGKNWDPVPESCVYTPTELIGYKEKYPIHTSTRFFRNLLKNEPEKFPFFSRFDDDYSWTVLLGMYGGACFVPNIKPSMYRRCTPSSTWTGRPAEERTWRFRRTQNNLYEIMKETGNEEWIKIRRSFI